MNPKSGEEKPGTPRDNIQTLTKILTLTIASNEQLTFKKLDNLDHYGTFWNFISLNAKVSTDTVDLLVDEYFQLDLDLSILSPSTESTVFLSYLAFFFAMAGDEAAAPPLVFIPGSSSPEIEAVHQLTPSVGRLPIITGTKDIKQPVVSFKFLTLPLPTGVSERTFRLDIIGSLAVTPNQNSIPLDTLGRCLPFSFDPQLRITTG